MCIQDIERGRRSGIGESVVTVATSATWILSPSPNRTAVIFSNVGANDIHISSDANVTNARGIVVPANGLPLECPIELYGRFVTGRIFAAAETGSTDLTILEVLSDEGAKP